MVESVVSNSGCGGVRMGDELLEVVEVLRSFLYDRVYASDRVLREEPRVTYVLSALFGHFLDNPPEACCCGDTALAALDHISGMTDRYALAFFERTILPSPWP